ncbi:hypothetical protein IPA_05865 [Ignicoccus pacificus DSM 13166]|uniref:Uncharacterized protein n=1 Tax=Ignicoccus pacificus DSM 13166 TaxID=940294 RepID=A0A977KCC2_9CREN|nr:hypothetical protein IPA_05865 [Ignicoccus pacificus DSM 13166]
MKSSSFSCSVENKFKANSTLTYPGTLLRSARKGTIELYAIAALGLFLLLAAAYYFFFMPHQMSPVQKAKAYKGLTVQLRPIKTKVCVGNEGIFELSIVNPLQNPKAYVQLVIMAPPGVTVYAGQGVKGGSGLVTTSLVVDPGDVATLRIRIIAVEPGKKIVSGTVYYWFEGESKQDARKIALDFPVEFVNCK